MPKKSSIHRHIIRQIRASHDPIVEVTGEGSATYVWFNRGARYARTVELSAWPVLNIDLDQDGRVIGVESIGLKEFTIQRVLEQAKLRASAALLSRTRYMHAESATAAASA